MNVLSALGAGFLFALACNLDTVAAAVGHGARGQRMDFGSAMLLAALTTGITFLSLCMGALGATLFPAGLAERLGGLALTALGLWYLLDALRGKDAAAPSAEKGGWVALSAALAVNNAGVGVAAGVTGLSPLLASACNFAVTLASLALGRRLGERLASWSRLALPLSGLLLVVLGLWQLA